MRSSTAPGLFMQVFIAGVILAPTILALNELSTLRGSWRGWGDQGEQCSAFTLCRCNTSSTGPKQLLNCPSTNGSKVIGVEGLDIVEVKEGAFDDITDVEVIDLDYNAIRSLPKNIFSSLTNLQGVSMRGNQIFKLDPDLFSGNPHLYSVHLDQNGLESIPAILFANHEEFTTLTLTINGIASLDGDSFYNTNVSHLDISLNKLTALPGNIFSSLSIQAGPQGLVNLTANDLDYLPAGIFSTVDSRVIYLSGNPGSKKGNCPSGSSYRPIKQNSSKKFCMKGSFPTPSATPSITGTPNPTTATPSITGTPNPTTATPSSPATNPTALPPA